MAQRLSRLSYLDISLSLKSSNDQIYKSHFDLIQLYCGYLLACIYSEPLKDIIVKEKSVGTKSNLYRVDKNQNVKFVMDIKQGLSDPNKLLKSHLYSSNQPVTEFLDCLDLFPCTFLENHNTCAV